MAPRHLFDPAISQPTTPPHTASKERSRESVCAAAVVEGSAAARAGIKAGDRIVSVNDVVLAGWGDLVRIVRTKLRGDVLKIVVKRGAELIELEATL